MRILISVIALMVVLPKVAIQCLVAFYQQKKITVWTCEYAGLNCTAIKHRTILVANSPIADIDLWLHYLKGNVNLTGPKAIKLSDAIKMGPGDKVRFEIAPGMISPYSVKKKSGIAHSSEHDIAIRFAKQASMSKRCVLILVWCVQSLLGSKSKHLAVPSQFKLFGVRITNSTMQTAINNIIKSLDSTNESDQKTSTFAFVNADCANHYYSNTKYKNILNSFDNVFPDGIGVKIAARYQGLLLKENVNGTDMFPLLCDQLNAKKKRVFLLGASAVVIKKTAEKIARKYPHITITGYIDGYRFNDQAALLCQHINQTDTDLLFVAMGAPRQEFWISDNIDKLNVKAAIGVGGLFDFYSGHVSRAPEWLRELSLEWLWRLSVQPLDKGKRYLIGNPLFLMHVFTQNMKQRYRATSLGA